MTATIVSGKEIAARIRGELAVEVERFRSQSGTVPKLAAVLVGDDPASQVYVRNKHRACQEIGMASEIVRLPADTSEESLRDLVSALNDDRTTHGILVQLPLPARMDPQRILDTIHPNKDVDAFHPENVGRIMQGRPRFLPCTPLGVLRLLMHSGIHTEGKHVVIVGRSDIVGKPLAAMLAQRTSPYGPAMANATVTVCHSRSQHLEAITSQADILIVAVGVPRMVRAEMIRPGAAVIDVGINRVDGELVGDVDFASALAVAGAITPVPGGVGPMTIAMLLHNTLQAAAMGVSGLPA